MITTLEAIILGIIQGITEFFPISSSGHLVLAESILKLDVESLFHFNVMVHVATLIAVVFYFRKTVWQLLTFKEINLMVALAIGTIPAIVAAFTVKDQIEGFFVNPKLVLFAMLATAIFFVFAEVFSPRRKNNEITISKSLFIGIAQAFALIPGVSRSGSTLAAGLLTKLDRIKAAEFSFLLAIPAIAGAGLFSLIDAYKMKVEIDWVPYIAGFCAALISGYFAIKILMNLYKKHSLLWFAVYLFVISLLGQIF